MSQSKSLAESLFEDLLNEAPEKTFEHKAQSKSITKNKKTKKVLENNTRISTTPDNDPLSDLVIKKLKQMEKIKKCHVRLPKIGRKKLILMIKKHNKKSKLKNTKKINKSNDENKKIELTIKRTTARVSRAETNQTIDKPTRKRKSSKSESPSPKKKSTSQKKLHIKLDVVRKSVRVSTTSSSSETQSIAKVSPIKKPLPKIKTKGQQKQNIDVKVFTKSNLQDTFGRQFFKCRVRVNKFRSLNNLNVTDLQMELERTQKKKLKKKTKGLNKSVSFVETVEVFGESDSEDNKSDLNKDIIELDATLDENNDGAGGDDGNLTVDGTPIKKQLNNYDTIENGDVSENIFTGGDDLIVSTPKEKLPGKIGRIRKSFSPLKSEEDQQSPRSKLLRKGDEKIVRTTEIILDDDDDNDDNNDVENIIVNLEEEITKQGNGSPKIIRLDSEEKETVEDESEKEKDKDDTDTHGTGKNGKVEDDTEKEKDKDDNDTHEEDADNHKEKDIDKEDNDMNKIDKDTQKENNEKDISQDVLKISDEYESLSSDDSRDFLDAKENDKKLKSKTNIDEEKNKTDKDEEKNKADKDEEINKTDDVKKEIVNLDDDEDDDYYLPKPKTSQTDEDDKTKDNEKQEQAQLIDDDDDDDVETIDKIMFSVNEAINNKNAEKNSNDGDEDNDIFHKVVESIDMLNSNIISGESPVQFSEDLKLSEDEGSHTTIEKEIILTSKTTTTTTEIIPQSSSPASNTKFSFNSFLKSSIETIKTKIMSESPKRSSPDDITTEVSDLKKNLQCTPENINDDNDSPILLPETDDDESSALLGDPVLGGREMSY